MSLNRSWFLYYGSVLGMSHRETLLQSYGDMISMINCIAIDRGLAEQKTKWKYEDVMNMR